MDFIYIGLDGIYRCKVLICTIPTPGCDLTSNDLDVKVTVNNIHIKVFFFAFKVV